MAIASDFLQSLVPISQFNKGQAAKIFDRLRSEKELIVLKNNQPCNYSVTRRVYKINGD